jgi:inositol polyphosphate 5-phosphatase INPP5B/F
VQGGVALGTSSRSQDTTAALPQIESVSPLSIGEITSAGGRVVEVNPFESPAGGEARSETRREISVDQGSLAPSMLVLGFQELDLSTEALIYNTGPAKEDAWVMACIAGLGESGDEWEKVSSRARSVPQECISDLEDGTCSRSC